MAQTVTIVRDVESRYIKGVYDSLALAVDETIDTYGNPDLPKEEQKEEIHRDFEFLEFEIETR